MHTVTESIYSGQTVVIFLADVQHIEKWDRPQSPGIRVITKHTRWDADAGDWTNAIWINQPEAATFMQVMCRYRSELEADTLMDLRPDAADIMNLHDKTMQMLKTPARPYHGEDFCITHGAEHMVQKLGNPIPYCSACEEQKPDTLSVPSPVGRPE